MVQLRARQWTSRGCRLGIGRGAGRRCGGPAVAAHPGGGTRASERGIASALPRDRVAPEMELDNSCGPVTEPNGIYVWKVSVVQALFAIPQPLRRGAACRATRGAGGGESRTPPSVPHGLWRGAVLAGHRPAGPCCIGWVLATRGRRGYPTTRQCSAAARTCLGGGSPGRVYAMGDTSEASPQTSPLDYMGMAIEEALRGA